MFFILFFHHFVEISEICIPWNSIFNQIYNLTQINLSLQKDFTYCIERENKVSWRIRTESVRKVRFVYANGGIESRIELENPMRVFIFSAEEYVIIYGRKNVFLSKILEYESGIITPFVDARNGAGTILSIMLNFLNSFSNIMN